MRNLFFCLLTAIVFASCKKDSFTTTPQIKFKNINPNVWSREFTSLTQGPVLTLELTDAEGDLGFDQGKDTAFVYVKNITIPPFETDSFRFPDLPISDKSNLSVDVDVLITEALASSNRPNPHTDTLYFDVYVKDFAKNKSNTIRTSKPVYYISP
ncbi:MAG: hypothetical protein FGM46_01490 [Ferruginibacter sp.]|nr:hypothetical protein [Ferruginibacter sp.]